VSLAYNLPAYHPATPTFRDVPTTQTFYQYIENAAHSNVVSGYNCGGANEPCPGVYFRPDALVTRGQLSKITVVAAGWSLLNPVTAHFNDVPRNSTFYTYIETAVCHQIISGYDCGSPGEGCPGLYFRPGNNATRGQIVKIVYNAISNLSCASSPSNSQDPKSPANQ
jgi:S-layer homology domain